jgi:hypothetical protein
MSNKYFRVGMIVCMVIGMIVSFLYFIFYRPASHQVTLKNSTYVYTGKVYNGLPQGQGAIKYQNGDSYRGNFKNGEPDGTGRFTSHSGWSYQGEIKMATITGKGTFISAKGKKTTGNFANGVLKNEN